MKYYRFTANDQKRLSSLMFHEQRQHPYWILKPKYEHLRCQSCGRFDHEAVFKEGFDAAIKIWAKGDMFRSTEGFLCVSEKFGSVVQKNKISGLDLQPLAGQPWFVVNVTRRVNADPGVYELGKRTCSACGRPKDVTGLIEYLSQIEVPGEENTFFSPIFDRKGNTNADRDVFATEDVVRHLKEGGIKGGYFTRLLDAQEEARIREDTAQGRMFKLPKGALIELGRANFYL